MSQNTNKWIRLLSMSAVLLVFGLFSACEGEVTGVQGEGEPDIDDTENITDIADQGDDSDTQAPKEPDKEIDPGSSQFAMTCTEDGVPEICIDQKNADLGDCESVLGWAYDGLLGKCTEVSGCEDETRCFYETEIDCAIG